MAYFKFLELDEISNIGCGSALLLHRIPSVSPAVLERSGPIPQNAPISGAPSAVVMDTNISQFCEHTG